MAEAQLGSAVLLSYRKPQAQQLGSNVLLNYNAGAEDPYFVPMFGGFRGVWGARALVAKSSEVALPPSKHVGEHSKLPWDTAENTPAAFDVDWDHPTLTQTTTDVPWRPTPALEVSCNLLPWGRGLHLSGQADPAWLKVKPLYFEDPFLIPWGDAARCLRTVQQPWEDTPRINLARPFLVPWGLARVNDVNGLYPWDKKAPSHDRPWAIVYPSGPVTDDRGTILVPVRRAYIMMNNVTARTVADNVELPFLSFNLSIDSSSWAWGFNATLPAKYLPYLQATALLSPIEILTEVNGEQFLLVIESVTRAREFGKNLLSISGRGQSAYLASPYSPTQHYSSELDKTCRQLFEDALTFNSVPLGWNVVWNIPDWLVPAGTWDFTGTYIEAISDIANAVGAYILPDPKLKTLSVNSRYPSAPSAWKTDPAYMQLPSAIVQTEGIEWYEKPAYNGMYVSGVSNGIVGFVRKDGTIGDYLAPQSSHALITHPDAVREVATSVLAATGRMATVTLSLPVADETGIIMPGNIIKYVDGGVPLFGISRAVSVTTNGVSMRQSIELEVHPDA